MTDNVAAITLTNVDLFSQGNINNQPQMNLSEAAQIYNTASQNQSNVKSLGSNVLKDVGRFVTNLSAQNRADLNRGTGTSENIFSTPASADTISNKLGTPPGKLDLQLERLKQTSDYAGFMAASVSLVSSGVASIKSLQQG